MSKFITPIHEIMYEKILNQKSYIELLLEEDIFTENPKEYLLDLGEIEEGPLEEVLDLSNIHASLSHMIDIVEGQLACTFSKVREDKRDRAYEIAGSYYLGHEENPKDPKAAFQLLNRTFLDGMPCDRVNEIVEDETDFLSWTRILDVHAPYWERYGLDPEIYHGLRDLAIEGLLKGSDIAYSRDGDEMRLEVLQ